jgi:trehalose-6-phosphate synthase
MLEPAGALLVNPHDIDGVAHVLKIAFDMPKSERIGRLKLTLHHRCDPDVHRLCDEFLYALAPEMAAPLPSIAQQASCARLSCTATKRTLR